MAKKRNSRLVTRRRFKWIGVALLAIQLVVYAGSILYVGEVIRQGTEHVVEVRLRQGQLQGRLYQVGTQGLGTKWFFTFERARPKGEVSLWFDWHWGKKSSGLFGRISWASVPLWFPLLLTAVFTVRLWRTDRPKPWLCATCRYDLRGLKGEGDGKWGGVCPECGDPFVMGANDAYDAHATNHSRKFSWLTWKSTFIAIVVLVNVLLFVVLGGAVMVFALRDLVAEPPEQRPVPSAVVAVIGLGLMGVGIGSLVCMRLAYRSQGRKRLAAIIIGLVLCAAVATLGIASSLNSSEMLGFFLFGSVSFATAASLLFMRSRRIQSWQCPKCAYDLRGLEGESQPTTCPECGTTKEP